MLSKVVLMPFALLLSSCATVKHLASHDFDVQVFGGMRWTAKYFPVRVYEGIDDFEPDVICFLPMFFGDLAASLVFDIVLLPMTIPAALNRESSKSRITDEDLEILQKAANVEN